MRARAAAAAELSRRLSAMGSTARSLVGSSRALLGSTAPPGLGTQRSGGAREGGLTHHARPDGAASALEPAADAHARVGIAP